MNRIQMACYALMASAFILAGLLLVRVQDTQFLPSAQADQVITRGNLTILSAKSRVDEEAIFVLDNISQRLLIYKVRLIGNQGRIELARRLDMEQLFTGGGAGAGGQVGKPAGDLRVPR